MESGIAEEHKGSHRMGKNERIVYKEGRWNDNRNTRKTGKQDEGHNKGGGETCKNLNSKASLMIRTSSMVKKKKYDVCTNQNGREKTRSLGSTPHHTNGKRV